MFVYIQPAKHPALAPHRYLQQDSGVKTKASDSRGGRWLRRFDNAQNNQIPLHKLLFNYYYSSQLIVSNLLSMLRCFFFSWSLGMGIGFIRVRISYIELCYSVLERLIQNTLSFGFGILTMHYLSKDSIKSNLLVAWCLILYVSFT